MAERQRSPYNRPKRGGDGHQRITFEQQRAYEQAHPSISRWQHQLRSAADLDTPLWTSLQPDCLTHIVRWAHVWPRRVSVHAECGTMIEARPVDVAGAVFVCGRCLAAVERFGTMAVLSTEPHPGRRLFGVGGSTWPEPEGGPPMSGQPPRQVAVVAGATSSASAFQQVLEREARAAIHEMFMSQAMANHQWVWGVPVGPTLAMVHPTPMRGIVGLLDADLSLPHGEWWQR